MLTLDHLDHLTRDWVLGVRNEYRLDAHHDRLLILAAQAFDRAEQARKILDQDGLTTGTESGGLKAHPCIGVERDSRLAFARLLRELDLDLVGTDTDASRPPSLRSNRG